MGEKPKLVDDEIGCQRKKGKKSYKGNVKFLKLRFRGKW